MSNENLEALLKLSTTDTQWVKRKFFGNKSESPKLLVGSNLNVWKSCRGPKLSEKSSCSHPVITRD